MASSSLIDQWDPNVEEVLFSSNNQKKKNSFPPLSFERVAMKSLSGKMPGFNGDDLEPFALPNLPGVNGGHLASLAPTMASLPSLQVPQQPTATSAPKTMLHRACQQFPNDRFVIKTALDLDPNAARQKASIPANSDKCFNDAVYRFVALPQRQKGPRKEPFQLPVNIALSNGANKDVLQLLVSAAPEVVAILDGKNGLTTLSLALTKRPQDNALVEILLAAEPQAVKVPDRRQNLPLHVACEKGASLDVVRHLFLLFPGAFHRENFHGETPLRIAQRNSKCSEDVLNFLQFQQPGSL